MLIDSSSTALAKNYAGFAAPYLPFTIRARELFVVLSYDEWPLQRIRCLFAAIVEVERVIGDTLGEVFLDDGECRRGNKMPRFIGRCRFDPLDKRIHCQFLA